MSKQNLSVKYVLAVVLIAVLAVALASPADTARAAPAGPQAVLAWNNIMVRTVVTNGGQSAPASFVYGAYVQAAVYNAVVAIEGGYQPYQSGLGSKPGASVDAAVATAAHDVLVHYFQGQQGVLDGDYQAFLASIPDGQAKSDGIQVGAAAAQELIELRQNDGLNANINFTMPGQAPGVWQLPSGASPLVPWMSKLRPFMMDSPDQFRPGPPPELSSAEWAEQYNEVLLYGRRDNSSRTPEQSAVAVFWTAHVLPQFNGAYRTLVQNRGLGALEAARLMAMGSVVGADSLIACFDAKYHYLFWRPAFAIPQGHTDDNPDTAPDPTFVPRIGTPPHPEYPSAHNCLTVSQAEVFVEFLGTQKIDVNIPGTGMPPRHFTYANDLKQEIIDARVWGGIHYRGSDVTGANLGRKVAHWTLKRYFLPE